MQISNGDIESQNKLLGDFVTKLGMLKEKIALGASSQQIIDTIGSLIEQNEAECRR